MKTWLGVLTLASLAVGSLMHSAYGWEDHAVPTYLSLKDDMLVYTRLPVTVESFENFVNSSRAELVKLCYEEDVWGRAHIPMYPGLSKSLFFRKNGTPADFLKCLRVNFKIKLALFLQRLPGAPEDSRKSVPVTAVSTLERSHPGAVDDPFAKLDSGEKVSVLDVVATASDEPDYGLDIGLWENSGTEVSQVYGFGKQPFGNPTYEFSSQAPFHIGYFHEEPIIRDNAGQKLKTFPELRIHQFLSLARLAFRSGHPYWGWRFTGWGMHYLQDLTQPYHAKALPGVSTMKALALNGLSLAHWPKPLDKRITLVSNRHFAIENYQFNVLKSVMENYDFEGQVARALRDGGSEAVPNYTSSYARDVVSAHSYRIADEADHILVSSLPAHLVSDPSYHFGEDQPVPNTVEVLAASDEVYQLWMKDLLIRVMKEFGTHSRQFVRAAQAQ